MKPNVLIGTPAYGGNCHADYVHSILGFRDGTPEYYDFSLITITNESLITRGRNTILSVFKNSPELTHLLFLDADMGVPKDMLYRLLQHDKDVIGVPVPLKGFDAKNNPVFNVGEILGEEGSLLKTSKVGTAILLFSRKVVDDLCEGADQYTSTGPTRRGDDTAINPMMYDVFQVGVVDGDYLSEDFWVCHKLIDLGYDLWLDHNISVKHNGNFTFQS